MQTSIRNIVFYIQKPVAIFCTQSTFFTFTHNQLRSDNTASQGVSVREGTKRRLKGAKFKLLFIILALPWKGKERRKVKERTAMQFAALQQRRRLGLRDIQNGAPWRTPWDMLQNASRIVEYFVT